ncbi:hypothetical protein ACPFP2_02155 [Micromonospora citrea]|uniref:hypothetical protein n=1 Tax=Micromonospora citrea TaxID=47855 RepID=UPI003C43DE4E
MPNEVWMSMVPLGGVVLGGLLSFGVQHQSQRSAQRAEDRRSGLALAESRRAERLAQLERFVEVTAEAERCAFNRPATWTETEDWTVRTQAVMNRVWVAERLIRLTFPPEVHDAARAYFLDLNLVVWEGLPEGQSVRDHLEANRLAFLDAARTAVG